jgi:predicted transcriptional regulator YheO
MKLIAIKTENGKLTGDIAFYCRVLKVSRQGFYNYLEAQKKP